MCPLGALSPSGDLIGWFAFCTAVVLFPEWLAAHGEDSSLPAPSRIWPNARRTLREENPGTVLETVIIVLNFIAVKVDLKKHCESACQTLKWLVFLFADPHPYLAI